MVEKDFPCHQILNFDLPYAFNAIPPGSHDVVPQLAVLSEMMLGLEVVKILKDLIRSGIDSRPVFLGLPRPGVIVSRDVTSDSGRDFSSAPPSARHSNVPWISILPPSAPNLFVLLVNRKVEIGK